MVFYYNWPVFDENRANYAKNAGYTTSRIQNKFLNLHCTMKLLMVPTELSLRMTIILLYALYEHIREPAQSFVCTHEVRLRN